jgi:sarcosine oxidase subunit gamma
LRGLAVPGRHGAAEGEGGVLLAQRTDLALATVMARRDTAAALAARVRYAFGLDPPAVPRRAEAGPVAFAWAGPGHWLATQANGGDFARQLRHALVGLASVTDQTDGRAVIRVRGIRARDALGKGVPLDLHPRAFAPGDAAVTTVAHIGVHLWQIDDAPTYELAVPRSFAAAFWRWLLDAGAEYGVEVEELRAHNAAP